MTENKSNKNIGEIVNSFEITMKKGFMSALILLLLEKDCCHGYKLQKEIDKRTLGYFQPTSSTIYPLLDSLNKKGLITYKLKKDGRRERKEYEITPKGGDTLKMILQKHSTMVESIKSIILSTAGITDEANPTFLQYLEKLISSPEMELLKEGTIDSKIDVLKYHKEIIKQQIKLLTKNLNMIDSILSNIKKEIQNENVLEFANY